MSELRNLRVSQISLSVLAVFGAVLLLGCAGNAATEAAQEPARTAQFLERLVGEWTYESEAMTGPDQPFQKGSGSETGRRVGNWVVLEGRVPTPMGTMTTLLTLGHDAHRGAPVATWVDSMSDLLWSYDGALDVSDTVLTLSTKGPNSQIPGREFHYRNVLTSNAPDTRELRSEILMDGEWVTFLRARYRRAR